LRAARCISQPQRGQVRTRGRTPARHTGQATANILTPVKALCLAERCAVSPGRDIDFVMNVFVARTGVCWRNCSA
jgi:hypothetical protein